MIRKLLFLLALIGVWFVVTRLARAFAAGGPRRQAGKNGATPRFEGAMVRDRVCETFIPRSRALSVRADDGEHFFCSEACRDRYLAEARPTASRG